MFNQSHAPFPSTVTDELKNEEILAHITTAMKHASLLGIKTIIVHPCQHIQHADDNNAEILFEYNMNFYKKLIALRKDADYANTLIYGDFKTYKEEQKNLLAFTRSAENTVMVIANYQKEAQTVELPSAAKKILLSNINRTDVDGTNIELSGYELLVIEV